MIKFKLSKCLVTLLNEQNDSYIFAFESNGDCFIGATPERLMKKENDQVYSACLAGSIARGKNDAEDELLGNTLLSDDKNLMEHQYVVEMIKDAMEDSCSEVMIPEHPQTHEIKEYPTFIHTGKWKSKSRYFTSFTS